MAQDGQVSSDNSSIVRQLILSGALLVLSTATNLWISKHAQDVPDAVIIGLFIIPLLPLAWWVYTHEKALRSRQRILNILRTRFMFSLLVVVVVGAIVGASLAGVGYTLWHRTQNTQNINPDQQPPKTRPPVPPPSSTDKTVEHHAPHNAARGKNADMPKSDGSRDTQPPNHEVPQSAPSQTSVNLNWTQDSGGVFEGKNAQLINFRVDAALMLPAFLAVCDRPCKAVQGIVPGASQAQFIVSPHDPRFAGVVFMIPRPLGPGIESSLLLISTETNDAPRVLQFRILKESDVPIDLR
jgi:hypothetical protein